MSEIKVNLLGNDFEKQINDSIKEIERLKNEKVQKAIEIEAKIVKAEHNYNNTDSEILKKQAQKDVRESKEELASVQKEYDEKIAEQQEKVKSLIEDLKIKIEQEKETAEEMMNRLHSDIKRWSEDEKTQKRLKASKAIATSIVELKEMLENETDDEAKEALEYQIEMLKGTLKNGAYTKSENDTELEALKSLAKTQNTYYEDYSKSLDKLDELEQIQIQLENMGIETEQEEAKQEEAKQEEAKQEETEQEETKQEETEQEETEQVETQQDEAEQDEIEIPEADETTPAIDEDELLEILGVSIKESADSRLTPEEAEVIFGGKNNDKEAIKRAQDARQREHEARMRAIEAEEANRKRISDDLGKINKFVSDNYERATSEKWQGSEYYATIYDECKQKLQDIEDIKWVIDRSIYKKTESAFNQAIEEVRDKIKDLYEKIQDKYKIAEKVKDIKIEIDGLIEEGKSIKRVKKEIKKRIKECEISDKAEEEINEYLTNKTPLIKKREGLLSRAVGGVKDFFFPELEEDDDDEYEIEETEDDVDITKVESLKTILAKKNDNTARIKSIAERSDLNIKEIKTILEFFNIPEDEYNEYRQLDKHGRFGFGIRFGGADTEKAQNEANKKEQDKTKSKSGITK